ncbi:MAG: rRNA pseudouridine synthase [Desulfobacterales bacterium]|nr:rRNA pseudouridine synthase [Desulfobacterales bacterium]
MRIHKYLSLAGFCSRRKGEEYILKGAIQVNGDVATNLSQKIDPDKDVIEAFGKVIKPSNKFIYIALNKPKGYVSSCKHKNEKIILELVDINERIYPVGRLDKDSTGLIFLTNDGRLHHKLSHPSFDHEKEYEVTFEKELSFEAIKKFEEGMFILGSKTRPAKVKVVAPKRIKITLQEGKNRQIRRMAEQVGNTVITLHRIRIDNIKLNNLPVGGWRYLSKKELNELLNSIE